MFNTLGKGIYLAKWPILVVGLLFVLVAALYGTSVFGKLKSGGFYDPDAESTRVESALSEQLGRDPGSLVVLFSAGADLTVDQPAFQQAVEATLAKVSGVAGVGAITNFYNSGASQLVSNDRYSTYAVIGLDGDLEAQADHLKQLRPLLTSDTLKVQLGGQAAVNEEILGQVSEDLERAETLTFPIVAVLLIIIFGSLVAAALPLVVGGITILGAFLLLRVASDFTDVSVFAVNVITMLGLGLAIDYSLFVVSRFREEIVGHNGDVRAALLVTMQTAGRTVLFSGLTVAISLLSLQVFPQMFLKSMGLGGAAAVAVAVLTALTILPAILALLGTRVNSLALPRFWRRGAPAAQSASGETQGFWYRTSRFVMRYPTLVLAATLVPMLLAGIPFLHIVFSTPDARSLPVGRESRVVSEALTDQFPRNETQPIQVLAYTPGGALEPNNLTSLYNYTRQIAALPGVTRIDSLVNLDPSLDAASYGQFYSANALAQNPAAAGAATHYAKGDYSVVSVIYSDEPLSATSQHLVSAIRALDAPGLGVQVGGVTASLVDFLVSLEQRTPVALGLIIVVVFVLLFLMLGSLVIPLKAVVLNILSLSVSFGALVWIFQDGNLSSFFNFTPVGSIDGTQPILIFAIAFGLAMDYEVFLLSRIKEHYDRTGDTTGAIAAGVQKTATIITSAALLLVVVIGAFATGEITFIKQIGVGLALAIFVDATIVRVLLVPATMRLLGKANWWAPAPLTALYNRLGLSEVDPAPHAATTQTLRPAPVEATTPQ